MSTTIQVFIENPAGSMTKNLHNEKTLVLTGSLPVARPYPLPYGFILGTTSEDGDNLDCYVLTNRLLCRGDVVACSVVGLMEQFEDGKKDHNILATLVDEPVELTESMKSQLQEFVTHVFDNQSGKSISVGKFLDAIPALSLIKQCSDKPESF